MTFCHINAGAKKNGNSTKERPQKGGKKSEFFYVFHRCRYLLTGCVSVSG